MALLGSTIDPRLFVQDYSGYVNAANTNANAMAGLGQTIAGSLEKYGEEKKERKKLDAGIKASVTGIESAIKMGKSLGIDIESSLSPYLQKINDPNISAVEAAAYAQEASSSISNAFNLGMKGRELTVQEGRYAQQDRASQAAAYIDANKLTLKNIDAGGRTGVPVLINAAGDMFSATNQDPIVDLTAYANGKGGTLTNNSVPDLTTDPTNAGGVLPELEINVPVIPAAQQAILDAGGAVPDDQQLITNPANQVELGLRAGNVNSNTPAPLGRPITENNKAETPMTLEQVQQLAARGFKINARPLADGSFMVSGADIGGAGETIESSPEGGFKITRGGGGGAKAEAAKSAGDQLKTESFRLNQANTEEAFKRLDTAGTNNALFAAGNALLAEALPASETGELAGFYERINGENSFIKMKQQRDSSITGGAAGTMTEKEWPRYEGRFSPLKINAKKDTIAKSLSLNLLNSFEAINGTPDDVIKLLNEKKINQVEYDKYVVDYMTNRQIARVNANGVEGKSYEWTKLNKNLLSKSTIYEAPTNLGSGVGLNQSAKDNLKEFLPKSK